MLRTKLSYNELVHRLIPVRYLDETGLELYRRLAACADGPERLRATVRVFNRLCELGYMRLVNHEESAGEHRITYRSLISLDTLLIALPSEPPQPAHSAADGHMDPFHAPPATSTDSGFAPEPTAFTPAKTTPEQRPSPAEATTSETRSVMQTAAVHSAVLTAVTASSRRVDLAGPLGYLFDFLNEILSCDQIHFRLSGNLLASQANSLAEIESILTTSDDDMICPTQLRQQVEDDDVVVHIPDTSRDKRLDVGAPAPPSGSLIVAPLAAEAYVYGTLEVWCKDANAFSGSDVATVAFVAEFAGGLIRRRLEIEELIFVDQTTQIHNRRYFDEQLTRELELSKRTGKSLAFLMIDIDDFKVVNDTYGHTAGDSVLRQIGKLLLENARQIDIVARYGGEEFAVILPRVTREGASTVAERIRASVSEHSFMTGVTAEPLTGLTISVGGALYPLDANTKGQLMDRADRVALYEAKRNGKNRVVFWEDTLRI